MVDNDLTVWFFLTSLGLMKAEVELEAVYKKPYHIFKIFMVDI